MSEKPGTPPDPIPTIDGAIDATLSGTRVVRGVYNLLKVIRQNHQLEDHARRLLGLDPRRVHPSDTEATPFIHSTPQAPVFIRTMRIPCC